MANDAAIRSALELLMLPTRVKTVRGETLPDGIDEVLRVVAGDKHLIAALAQTTGRSPDTLHQAAAFYIEQVLLHPDADFYRNLGSSPGASNQDLRQRMALLMAWLHPDKGVSTARQALAQRVMDAWHSLSNDARRADYDAALGVATPHANALAVLPVQVSQHRSQPYVVPTASRRRRFLDGLKAFMLGQRPPLA